MKKITAPNGVFGPYNDVQSFADHHLVDGATLPFVAIGGQGTVADWTDPLPPPYVDPAYALAADADAAIKGEATVALVKGMTWADYGTWWGGKGAAFKDTVLKYILWVICKRLL